MSDAHHSEAREHLVRIQARIAEDAVSKQRLITEKLTNTRLGELGQRALTALLAEQLEPNPYCEAVLASIARGVDAACDALGLDLQKGIVRGVLPVRGLGALSSDFYGTGVAIVAIDGSLVPFTGMLTDLLAASFEYRETENGLAIVMDEACCLERITGGKTLLESSEDAREARDTLVHHWERFFLHFWVIGAMAPSCADRGAGGNQIPTHVCDGGFRRWARVRASHQKAQHRFFRHLIASVRRSAQERT